jgi:hypothetical protein
MRVFRYLLFLVSAYLAAWLAAYLAVSKLLPATAHAISFFGWPVPGGEIASAVLTFSWAFFLVIIGLALAYQRVRGCLRP